MTVYLVISVPKIPYIHRIYIFLANPKNTAPAPAAVAPGPTGRARPFAPYIGKGGASSFGTDLVGDVRALVFVLPLTPSVV